MFIKNPLFNLTTDIIVGFPGETEDDFEASCRAVKDLGFSHVHTFTFSVRKGTRAATMPDQVEVKVKKERSEIIRRLSEENKLSYYSRFTGKKQTVLVERITGQGLAKGFGEYYLPVEFKPQKEGRNYFTGVVIRSVDTSLKLLRGIEDPV